MEDEKNIILFLTYQRLQKLFRKCQIISNKRFLTQEMSKLRYKRQYSRAWHDAILTLNYDCLAVSMSRLQRFKFYFQYIWGVLFELGAREC